MGAPLSQQLIASLAPGLTGSGNYGHRRPLVPQAGWLKEPRPPSHLVSRVEGRGEQVGRLWVGSHSGHNHKRSEKEQGRNADPRKTSNATVSSGSAPTRRGWSLMGATPPTGSRVDLLGRDTESSLSNLALGSSGTPQQEFPFQGLCTVPQVCQYRQAPQPFILESATYLPEAQGDPESSRETHC